jgi:outer membrane receptor for ferrienterochelin and colicins
VQRLNTTSGLNYEDYFRQQFYRVENQTDYTPFKDLSIIGGAGYISEKVNSTRYDSKDRVKGNEVKYGFLQADWKPFPKVTVIAGFRYDDNKLYASVFSPKIAAQYAMSDHFRLQFSFGQGFKAPDFRQLYLNFTNTAAGGYSVFGALEAQRVIALQQQSSLIRELTDDYYRLQQLRPEYSSGYNAGFNWKIGQHLQWQANVFRNDIRDLIESRLVATRVDNSQIFSYINIKNALTQGLETSLRYSSANGLVVEGGYQLLYTADKTEWQRLKSGGYYFTRDANNFSVPLRREDYTGLPNRSRHMANLKITYEHSRKHWFVTVRNMYRSQWAVFDRDGNGIYNKQDDFARGFLLVKISMGKEFDSGITLMAGSDNLTGHVDANNLPNMPGRTGYISFQYSFTGRKKQ